MEKQSLYTPQYESDACGIGLLADLNGTKSHSIVSDALTVLERMEHRGACGCEPDSGDGAGVLLQIPHAFLSAEMAKQNVQLPDYLDYGAGMVFLPQNEIQSRRCLDILTEKFTKNDFTVLGFRPVPVNSEILGKTSRSTEPRMVQIFVKANDNARYKELDTRLYYLRSVISKAVGKADEAYAEDFYFASLSARTMVYKGQLTATQVRDYFPDLSDPLFKSAIALCHSRFSTNTVPKWRLAQPFRCIAHNGEINTVKGNTQWWKAREADMTSKVFTPAQLQEIMPICEPHHSDSGSFDAVLEYLVKNGRTMPHALMMMIPEAWQNDPRVEQYKKDFYEFHEHLIEPWDGPASLCFTDGTLVGATLDRNGLRPSRYIVTDDNRLILGSEAGCLEVPADKIVYKGRLQPGKILIADLDEHRIVGDEELKRIICNRREYGKWLDAKRKNLSDLPPNNARPADLLNSIPLLQRQLAAGMTKEDENMVLRAVLHTKKEPIGSMGTDIPLAVLSRIAQHPANYFKQQFAQVTNPAIDPLREKFFMTLQTYLGGYARVVGSGADDAEKIRINSPLLDTENFLKLKYHALERFKTQEISAVFPTGDDRFALQKGIENLCAAAEKSVRNGTVLLFISDKKTDADHVAIPSLLATGAVHHHLLRKGLRRPVSLITVGADITETHHCALLFSYGADAVHPYLAIEVIKNIAPQEKKNNAEKILLTAMEKGLLKIMSKLGISTIQSYKGAQTFEALGLSQEVIDLCFTDTVSRIGGMKFSDLQREAEVKHNAAFITPNVEMLADVGAYQWKRRGEYHLFNPTTVHLLQQATSRGDYKTYRKFAAAIDKQEEKACTLRSLFAFTNKNPIPLTEVEPVEKIFKRFATGAMSFGSISHEAHTALAIAMNRIGGKSNSGEGGEDEVRFAKKENGDWERSAIKQVASGRFGVTINYLNNADEIQIKIAQGAKPGEGGHLPGHKVNPWIARVRHSTPGVGLISPPPHHDIYSIEDLAQLIYDLKNANEDARISVKLVSKAGVGIIASGVTKGHADHILISGYDGGTGASPLSSIRHAGIPWELGLAETHQTLLKNGLRDRVTLQTDGQIRTGRDMAIASILGAEEWGIATAALVVEGCILMRKCHLNTCPVGIATQDENLRKEFKGKVEHLINYFTFLAQDLREIMAELGVRTVNELVGQTQYLKQKTGAKHWKANTVDLSKVLFRAPVAVEQTFYKSKAQDHGLNEVLDQKLIRYARLALEENIDINSVFPVKTTDRALGTMLSSKIAKKYGSAGLKADAISFRFRGSAGQSFGAFGAKGIKFTLEGEANDYFGKGLSGGKLILVPDRHANFAAEKNIIVGNVALYGATSGEVYIKGMAGERFAVRNSGATAVVEGIGDNGCEYMTGGKVLILGNTGKNFAAGMSGGEAFLFNPSPKALSQINPETVLSEVPTAADLQVIRDLLRNFFMHTSSMRALRILNNWEQMSKHFVKVMPVEYKRVLESRLNADSEGQGAQRRGEISV